MRRTHLSISPRLEIPHRTRQGSKGYQTALSQIQETPLHFRTQLTPLQFSPTFPKRLNLLLASQDLLCPYGVIGGWLQRGLVRLRLAEVAAARATRGTGRLVQTLDHGLKGLALSIGCGEESSRSRVRIPRDSAPYSSLHALFW